MKTIDFNLDPVLYEHLEMSAAMRGVTIEEAATQLIEEALEIIAEKGILASRMPEVVLQ